MQSRRQGWENLTDRFGLVHRSQEEHTGTTAQGTGCKSGGVANECALAQSPLEALSADSTVLANAKEALRLSAYWQTPGWRGSFCAIFDVQQVPHACCLLRVKHILAVRGCWITCAAGRVLAHAAFVFVSCCSPALDQEGRKEQELKKLFCGLFCAGCCSCLLAAKGQG